MNCVLKSEVKKQKSMQIIMTAKVRVMCLDVNMVTAENAVLLPSTGCFQILT